MRQIKSITVETEEDSHIGKLKFTEKIENPRDSPKLALVLIDWLQKGLQQAIDEAKEIKKDAAPSTTRKSRSRTPNT